jgi:spermidine/putrescine transport system permease protein
MRTRFLTIHSFLMLCFIYVPILIIIVFSFNDSRVNAVWQGFTWEWYSALWNNRQVMDAFMNSLIIAVLSTLISTVLGTMAAYALRPGRGKTPRGVAGVLQLPILIPDIIMGVSLLTLFSRLAVPLGMTTVLIAHITFSVSYVYVIVSARLAGMGRQLEEAAQDLGATPWLTFRYITLPAMMPGIVSGALIAFTLSIDDFLISYFVAGPQSTTLPIYVYAMVKRGISPEINALSTLLIAATVILIVIAETVRLKGSGRNQPTLPL